MAEHTPEELRRAADEMMAILGRHGTASEPTNPFEAALAETQNYIDEVLGDSRAFSDAVARGDKAEAARIRARIDARNAADDEADDDDENDDDETVTS